MPKKRFRNEQIAFALWPSRERHVGWRDLPQDEVAEATFYRWKKVYAGRDVSEIRRLKQLEEQNAKLKRLVADLSLDKSMLQVAPQKSGEAHPAPQGGPALPGGVRRVGAPGLPGRRLWTGFSSLQVVPRS